MTITTKTLTTKILIAGFVLSLLVGCGAQAPTSGSDSGALPDVQVATADAGPMASDTTLPPDQGAVPDTTAADTLQPGCGNGVVEPGELCDDNNLDNGDGCSADCLVGHCLVPVTHPSIASGIADSACTTVYVASGTYQENVSVDRDVTLQGVGLTRPRIDGQALDTTVTVGAHAVVLRFLEIAGGQATSGAGISASSSDLTVEDSLVTQNLATGADPRGGGISMLSGTLTLTATRVEANQVLQDGTPPNGLQSRLASGGGLYAAASNVTITNSTFALNRATTPGTLLRCRASGGAVFGAGSTVMVDGSAFEDNLVEANGGVAGGSGGAITAANSDVTVHLSQFRRNQVQSVRTRFDVQSTVPAWGGAIYFVSSLNKSLSIDSADFRNNTAFAEDAMESGVTTAAGGAVYVNAVGSGVGFQLRNSNIADSGIGANTAFGGGVYMLALSSSSQVIADVHSTTFSGNQVQAFSLAMGGGLHAQAGSGATMHTRFVNSTISANAAQMSFGHTSPTRGGGIALLAPFGAADLAAEFSNVTIYQNSLDARGGLEQGAGVSLQGPDNQAVATFRNSILADNQGSSGVNECFTNSNGQLVSAGYNALGATSCTVVAGPGDVVAPASLLDALAVSVSGPPTHLPKTGSIVVDAGNPNGCQDHDGNLIGQDQRGQPRVNGAACDIGAAEL